MPNWRTIDETDLAATISQSEIDAFRQDASLDGSDPVARLLDRTVATVRGLVSCNGSVRMCPVPQTLPLSLISPAMDYAAYDILKRLPVPVGEDRRKARERADALFEKIATGQMTVESYTEDGSIDEDKRPATSPMADDGARPILGGGMWSILAAAVLSLSSASARTFDWHLRAPRSEPVVFDAYHGETVRFNLVFPDALSNAVPVAIYYQTNGMDRAEWFPPVPGTVFAPSNDVGAAAYRFFIRCTVPDGVDYTPNGTLRMLPSPGFEPSTVELPVKTLDFATIEVENAPWPTPGDIEDAVAAATNETLRAANAYTDGAIAAAGGVTPSMVTNIVNDIAPTPGDYETVSNAAMNALSIQEAMQGYTDWKVRKYEWGDDEVVDIQIAWMDTPLGMKCWCYWDAMDEDWIPIIDETNKYTAAMYLRIDDKYYEAIRDMVVPWRTSDLINNSDFVNRSAVEAGWWSEWVVAVTMATNITVTGLPFYQPHDQYHDENYGWFLPTNDGNKSFYVLDEDADTLAIDKAQDGWVLKYTATRHRVSAPVPTKPSDIGAATPGVVTNIVRDLSLGGIWDATLEVWWTPRMRGGSLTYEATTNVNMNAEN